MLVRQIHIKDPLNLDFSTLTEIAPQLLLVFGDVAFFSDKAFTAALAVALPEAIRIGCSTAGEITASGVFEKTCVLTAVHFEHTTLHLAQTRLYGMKDSQAAGARLAEQLNKLVGLQAVLVYGQGVAINGSAVAVGLNGGLGASTPITGGLAGDGGAFSQTFVLGQGDAADDLMVAVGLYGEHLEIAHGSFGGWSPFGPVRMVTRCAENVLFELDGERALDIYKRYLGEYARDLPASGLLFPFAIVGKNQEDAGLIRTILGVDEEAGSLILAGEIGEGSSLKLMHATSDKLIEGAERAATVALDMVKEDRTGLAILVSCVGRKLVMGDSIDEEVEAVADMLGRGKLITGFYSYGEICPNGPSMPCCLHNQTMTITLLAEK